MSEPGVAPGQTGTGPPGGSARPPLDLSLYLVTDTRLCGDTGVAATVAAAVAGGVSLIQLRDHDATDVDFVTLGRQVRDVLTGTGVPLLIDDRLHLVEEIGADGAHVGQADTDVATARARLGDDAWLGLSVHTVEQVQDALRHGPDTIDYLGVGPVWPTRTKPGHPPALGEEGLRQVIAVSPWPCVAIGGITADRATKLWTYGIHGVAVVSAVCGAADPGQAARTLRHARTGGGSS